MLVSNQTLRSNNMNYIHLTIEERACISKFKEMNMSLREMAKILNRNVSTISRELKRNSYTKSINHSVTRYSPVVANKKRNYPLVIFNINGYCITRINRGSI